MPGHGDQHMFHHARNTAISGGTFINVLNSVNSGVNGFQILLENVSKGALHNAAERGDPPRCHLRTRLAIRAEIMEWIRAPRAQRKLILWMYGPAGSGKTAIAQSIAEECERLRLLAASFFFWRSAAGRNDASQFVATLAYQLSQYIPHMKDRLITAIEKDPIIFSRSLSTQMHVLVIEPLQVIAPSLSVPIAAIVDGIDECGPDGRSQSALLHVLGEAASELQHLPLIFLISSRPEYEIREAFNGNYLNPLAKILVLDNNYKPDEDIKLYFDSTFQEIQEKNLRLGWRLPSPWPTPSDINHLVSKASGQFIFASTVIKFVDSARHNPEKRLNIVLHWTNVGKETPFAPLDLLYRFILESVADVEKVLEVLTVLLFDNGPFCKDLDDVEELLGFDVRRVLVDMHALLSVPPPTENYSPKFYHASLSDFLQDRSRSAPEYHIDETYGYVTLCRRYLRLIGSRDLPQDRYWPLVSSFVHHSKKLHLPGAQELVEELACFNLRAVLEKISDFREDLYSGMWGFFMECIEKLGAGREDVFPRLQKEFNAFIVNRIDQYPPSLKPYVPIFLFIPYGRHNIFPILLHGVSKSAEELNELRELDRRLLHLSASANLDIGTKICDLFEVAVIAGQYVVDGGSHATLAKTIINILWPRLGERNHRIMFREGNDLPEDSADPTAQIVFRGWSDLNGFEYLLERASIDVDLACLLRERVVHFGSDAEPISGWNCVVESSIKYITRCEGMVWNSDDNLWGFLPKLLLPSGYNLDEESTTVSQDAVVENIPRMSPESPLLPLSISDLSDADVEFTLALADEFNVATCPFTHILQFLPSPNGTLMVSFAGDEAPFGYLTY